LQIDEAAGATEAALGGFFDWRKQVRVDGTWRPWSHKLSDGSDGQKGINSEEELIEEAVSE
jgi:hypothetical protein